MVTIDLRINTAGAVTTTSTPVITSSRIGMDATTTSGLVETYSIELPADGMDIPFESLVAPYFEELQFGVTFQGVVNNGTMDVLIIGYEY